MRIRKLLKGVPLSDLHSFYRLNYVPNQPITCQLNQSPWDDTPPEQADGEATLGEITLFGVKISMNPSSMPKRNVVKSGVCIQEEEHEATNGSGQRSLEIKGKGKVVVDHDEASVRETRASREIKGKGKAAVVFDEASFRESRGSRGNKRRGNGIVISDEASLGETRACGESKGMCKDVIVDDEASLGKTRASRNNKGKEKVVVIDKEEKYCALVDNDGWQCGKPVKEGFEVCKRHWQYISPLVGRKGKPPVKTLSSSSRKRDGDHDQSDETPENKKQINYYYY